MRKASDTCLNVNRTRFTFNGILLKFGDERMELSQKLKELRKKQGLTQLELAERLFVSRQAITSGIYRDCAWSRRFLTCHNKMLFLVFGL